MLRSSTFVNSILTSWIICLLFIFAPGTVFAEASIVNNVTVSITSDEQPPELVVQRVERSVKTVGEQVFVGRTVEDIVLHQAGYERLVQEVFDRVLVGYYVDSVVISPEETTHITIKLSPWGEVVHQVAVEMDISNMSPELQVMLRNDVGNLKKPLEQVLVGMPIDALDWAGGVAKNIIREILMDKLPEFRPSLEVIPGKHTIVKISFIPQGPIIQDTHVSLRSHTIPNLFLQNAKPDLEEVARLLRGVPVAFAERHRDEFSQRLQAVLAKHQLVKKYQLAVGARLIPATDTEIDVDVETKIYKVTLEGYMDVGQQKDNTAFVLHVGQFVGERDELYLETKIIPASITWQFDPGWSHRFGKSTFAGFKYGSEDKQHVFKLNQQLGRDWNVRYEKTPATGHYELGFRYKFHDFIDTEYIFSNEKNWLRFIAQF